MIRESESRAPRCSALVNLSWPDVIRDGRAYYRCPAGHAHSIPYSDAMAIAPFHMMCGALLLAPSALPVDSESLAAPLWIDRHIN